MGKIEKTGRFVRPALVLSSLLVFSLFLTPSAMAVENVEPDVTASPSVSPGATPLPEDTEPAKVPETDTKPPPSEPGWNGLPVIVVPSPEPVIPVTPAPPAPPAPEPAPAPTTSPVEPTPEASLETTAPVETPEPEEEFVLPTEEATPTESAVIVPIATPSSVAAPSKAAAAPLKVQAQKITESVVATGSSPVVQALVIAFLLLLGFWYFRIMRHGGKRGPATSLKTGE